MRGAALVLFLMLAACQTPTGPDSGDPREDHVLAETQRFAGILHVKVRAVVTDEVYMTTSSDGTRQVPAAGWYSAGLIKYWRPVILERSLEYGTALAAHETCHAVSHFHDAKHAACEAGLR